MSISPLREVTNVLSKHWWAFLIRGILAILFGIVAWVWPSLTLGTLVWLAGFWLVFDGASLIGSAIANRDRFDRIWPMFLLGIAGIIGGILIMALPGLTAVWLIVTIGLYAIFSGVFGIIQAIHLRKEIENEWSLGLFGLISIVFGLLMVIFPGTGAISLLWMIAIYAIMIGVTEIIFAFRIRKAGNEG